MNRLIALLALLPMLLAPGFAHAGAVDELLQQYRAQGAGDFDARRGAAMWERTRMQPKLGREVSCSSCHTTDLTRPGRHIRTGKHIDPLSPHVTPTRLSDVRTIEKWFRRNCRWTWGRACTPQEKGDILRFIQAAR